MDFYYQNEEYFKEVCIKHCFKIYEAYKLKRSWTGIIYNEYCLSNEFSYYDLYYCNFIFNNGFNTFYVGHKSKNSDYWLYIE